MRCSIRSLRAVAAAALLAACGVGPRQQAPGPAVDEILETRPRVLWVAAHPDDESMAGTILAKACVRDRDPCHFVVFNKGRGGECNLPGGCHPNLGDLRHRELVKAARLYHSALEHYDFFNAPLPVESFPTRVELQNRWMSEGDPAGLVARAIRRFRPDVMVTLDPYQGFTGHPEHQAAARFALAGARLAADPAQKNPLFADEPPHRVPWVLHVQNKYWFMGLAGDPHDPKPYHEAIPSTDRCDVDRDGDERRCIDVVAEHTRVHHTQNSDMRAIRAATKFWGTVYVRRLDPLGEEAASLVADLEIPGLR